MFARTERLLLRPIWPEDATALFEAVADESIVRNLARVPWPYTQCDAAQFAGLEHDELHPNFMLMLRTDGAPKLVGSCGLADRDGEVELGYWLARPYWGQGLATEAARAVVGVAKALGHERLVSGHFTDNPASGRVLRKVGFRPVGRCEERYSVARGGNVNCALYDLPLTSDASAEDVAVSLPLTRMPMPTQMMQAAA
jgi:RimJ/RimL family protein N-acetyltransferase